MDIEWQGGATPLDGGFSAAGRPAYRPDGRTNIVVAKHPSAEEWLAEVDSIVHLYREETRRKGPLPLTRGQAIERMVALGLSKGDAIRYLDRNLDKPAVPRG